jgi:hypothetical protein
MHLSSKFQRLKVHISFLIQFLKIVKIALKQFYQSL